MPQTAEQKALADEVFRMEHDRHVQEIKEYVKVKSQFERVVQAMQADLAKYAAREDASQRAVDTRTDMINALVEFYEYTNILVNDANWQQLSMQIAYSKLHDETQKLVYFSSMHGVDANMTNFYTKEELLGMINAGARFIPPTKSFDNMRIVASPQPSPGGEGAGKGLLNRNYEIFYDEPDISEKIHAEYSEKYATVQQLCMSSARRRPFRP